MTQERRDLIHWPLDHPLSQQSLGLHAQGGGRYCPGTSDANYAPLLVAGAQAFLGPSRPSRSAPSRPKGRSPVIINPEKTPELSLTILKTRAHPAGALNGRHLLLGETA